MTERGTMSATTRAAQVLAWIIIVAFGAALVMLLAAGLIWLWGVLF